MPAPESFANIVDTLVSVRKDYHEQLKSIPQYQAFLLIESSTEKAAEALHGTEASSPSIAADVIDSLQYARDRFAQHMASLPQYRVLVAIDRLIKDVSQHLGLAGEDAPVANDKPAATAADQPAESLEAVTSPESAEADEPVADATPREAEVVQPAEPAEAHAPTLRIVEAPVRSPSIVPVDHDADAAHDDDIVVLNGPAWEKNGRDTQDDITARLAAQAVSAVANGTGDGHDEAETDLVIVSKREPSDHEAA